jgi:hypothetical protein
MKNIKIKILSAALALGLTTGCNKFLDIVPDNAPVLDQAFAMRSMAQRYLATCYSSIPAAFTVTNNPGIFSGDEFWLSSQSTYSTYYNWRVALGFQNSDKPLLNAWDGNNGANSLWIGITNCNIFLENIIKVPDMEEAEKNMWASEVKFLKAYYHFLLLRKYGPIPIKDVNIPVQEDSGASNLARNSTDECFDYIINLIDESIPALMDDVTAVNSETGRITKIIAKAEKAEIMMYRASPLFNGNNGPEANLKNADGKDLFSHTYTAKKWEDAALACKEAIDFAESLGKKLHTWTVPAGFTATDNTKIQMSIRESFNESSNNPEVLWMDTRTIASSTIQGYFALPRYTTEATNSALRGNISATLNIVEKFYSKNGVPINEDVTFPYNSRYDLIAIPNTDNYKYDLVGGQQTARLNLDRENRFYATLMFDAGRLFMAQNKTDASAYNINLKYSGPSGKTDPNYFNITGYASKKHYNYQNTVASGNSLTTRTFGYPLIRLANLYLYYAEALNELNGPSEDAINYINKVRQRSGLKGVIESWTNFSSKPNKPNTKEGLREIIKAERTCELALEGIRYYDVLRWKDAVKEFNTPIMGWDINQYTPASYYRTTILYTRAFIDRDYFTPISLNERRRNTNLVQAAGW